MKTVLKTILSLLLMVGFNQAIYAENKIPEPKNGSDAIGGAINLVTKNTPYKRVLNATAGSGYNWVADKMQLNLGLTYGDRYFDDKLGVMLATSSQDCKGITLRPNETERSWYVILF